MRYVELCRVRVENGDQVQYEVAVNHGGKTIFTLGVDEKSKVIRAGTELVVRRPVTDLDGEEALPRDVDVTAECVVELRRSTTSNGHYPFQSNRSGRYRIGHVSGATVSFRIMRRT